MDLIGFLNCSVFRRETIDVLSKFRYVDKYEAFHEILPCVLGISQKEKDIVSEILDSCCTELLRCCQESERPNKTSLKKLLVVCMDSLSVAPINAVNREFGYQLGWYLSEKVDINLKKGTEKKLWGYWQIEGDEVKAPIKPRISAGVREKKNKRKQSKKTEPTCKAMQI
jgi:hypothetical protein